MVLKEILVRYIAYTVMKQLACASVRHGIEYISSIEVDDHVVDFLSWLFCRLSGSDNGGRCYHIRVRCEQKV